MNALWSAAQIQGRRDHQEDRFAVVERHDDDVCCCDGSCEQCLPDRYLANGDSLFLLADGMGGMGHGDEAAELAVYSFVDYFTVPSQAALKPADQLRTALAGANRSLDTEVHLEPDKDGMGTTLVALLWHGARDTLDWLAVGDSRLLLYRDGQLQELSERHNCRNLVTRLLAAGDYTRANELRWFGDALYSAVDGKPLKAVDTSTLALHAHPGDLYLLASDGLDTLPDGTIADTLAPWYEDLLKADGASAGTVVEGCTHALFQQLEQADAPYQDNCTALVVGIAP